MENEKRHETFFVITGVGSLLVAFLVSGWITDPLDLTIGLIIAAIGSLVTGVVTGENVANKLYHSLAAMITSAGAVVTTIWYIDGRSSVWNLELIVPVGLGAIPGIIAYFLFRHLDNKPPARALAAVVFGSGMIFFMSQAIPVTEQGIREQERIVAENMPAIAIHPDARGVIRSQFGKPADDLLKQLDIVNSMLEFYAPEKVASETSAISNLEKTLRLFEAHAGKQESQKMLQADADFRSYREIVGGIRIFLDKSHGLAEKSKESGENAPLE